MVDIWKPEAQLSSWIGNSIVLMTGSVVFYGFTKINDPVLEINPYMAAVVTIGLIIIDVCLSITALIPYNSRVSNVLDNGIKEDHVNYLEEDNIRIMYTVLIGFFIFIQLIICFYVILDTFKRVRKGKKSGKRNKVLNYI